jgi:hypothetical protein
MMTPRGVFGAAFLAATGGLAGIVAGLATGNVPLAVAGAVVVMGAFLAPAVADWREAEARRRGGSSADVEPGSDMRPDIQRLLSEIKAYYAGRESGPDGGRRFQERVVAEDSPGWER